INYDLKPGIYRQSYIRHEHTIFKEFILKEPNDFLNDLSALEKLVKMQHYGLPTRLLDITTNPVVALYFACYERGKRDGQVMVFRITKKDVQYYDSDTVSSIANIAKRPSFNFASLDISSIEKFNEEVEIAY